jgi:hypothetical protein
MSSRKAVNQDSVFEEWETWRGRTDIRLMAGSCFCILRSPSLSLNFFPIPAHRKNAMGADS